MMRLAGFGLTCLGLTGAALLGAGPVGAQTRQFSPACYQQCNAPTPAPALVPARGPAPAPTPGPAPALSRDPVVHPPAIQVCLIRCQAGSDFARTVNAAPRRALGVTTAAPASIGSYGVIYAATPPGSATGVSQGQRDRNLAHMAAERACASLARARCTPLAEAAPGECVAAAQASRTTGLVRTTDPRSFQVTLVAHGKGAVPAEAERAAIAACAGRGQCEVVATACGAR